jgi:hypothetical protein
MISIDMNIAKNIWRNKIRNDRQPLMEKLDVEFLRAIENNDIGQQDLIKSKKQILRDAPADPRIDQASTTEELITINPILELENKHE